MQRVYEQSLHMLQSRLTDLEREVGACKLFTIKPSHGKGVGAFAAVDIKCGTRIIAEAPMLIMSTSRFMAADVQRAFHSLSATDKQKYMQLTSSHGQDSKAWQIDMYGQLPEAEKRRIEEQHAARTSKNASALSIFQNNCMEREGGAAVFYECARFNHSCVPNAFFAWNVLIRCETIHAIRDIPEGEEITISYCDPLYDRSMRAWQLKHYNFKCECPACGDEAADDGFAGRSTERRFRLRELSDSIEKLRPFAWIGGEKGNELLLGYLEMAGLLIEEGLRTGELGRHYIAIAALREHRGKVPQAIDAAKVGVDILQDCFGSDHKESIQARQMLERLEGKRYEEKRECSNSSYF